MFGGSSSTLLLKKCTTADLQDFGFFAFFGGARGQPAGPATLQTLVPPGALEGGGSSQPLFPAPGRTTPIFCLHVCGLVIAICLCASARAPSTFHGCGGLSEPICPLPTETDVWPVASPIRGVTWRQWAIAQHQPVPTEGCFAHLAPSSAPHGSQPLPATP